MVKEFFSVNLNFLIDFFKDKQACRPMKDEGAKEITEGNNTPWEGGLVCDGEFVCGAIVGNKLNQAAKISRYLNFSIF